MDLKILIFHCKNKVFGANGVPKNEPENEENLEKMGPRGRQFLGPKMDLKMLVFPCKKNGFRNKRGPQK